VRNYRARYCSPLTIRMVLLNRTRVGTRHSAEDRSILTVMTRQEAYQGLVAGSNPVAPVGHVNSPVLAGSGVLSLAIQGTGQISCADRLLPRKRHPALAWGDTARLRHLPSAACGRILTQNPPGIEPWLGKPPPAPGNCVDPGAHA